jgi:hypothetical protein
MIRLSLNSFFFRRARLLRSERATIRRRDQLAHPSLQALEDRFAPATISWTNPLGGNWGTPSNWDANRVPTGSDDVLINQTGITITHSFGIDSVRSLTSQAAVVISGGSLTLGAALSQINDNLTTSGNGTLVLNNATLSGVGSLINGATFLAEANSNINAALTNASGATVRVLGNAFSAGGALTVANGFTNDGLIDLTSINGNSPATLSVGDGTLTNAPDGLIRSSVGTNGTRTLNAQIDNQGTISALQGLIVGNNGHTFTCTAGILNADAGQVLAISGGTSVFGNGTMLAGSGTVDLAGAQILALASDLTLPNTGAGLTLSGIVNVLGPGSLFNQRTLDLTGDTVNTALINQGVLLAEGNSNLNGALTNAPGAIVRVPGFYLDPAYDSSSLTLITRSN